MRTIHHISQQSPCSGQPTHHRESGFLTIQGIAAVALFAILAAALAQGFQLVMAYLQKRVVAEQLQQVASAAKDYAISRALLETLTPGAEATRVESASLISAGLLPQSDTTTLTNPWGQRYVVYYFVPITPDNRRKLVTVVLTEGGEAVSDAKTLAVTHAGAAAGIVIQKNNEDMLRGVGGSYSIPLGKAPMNIPSPGSGHIGYYLQLDDAALLSDTLYRVAVPGRSELNQMQVDLDMSDHSLSNVQSVQFNATSVTSLDLESICGSTEAEKQQAEGKVFFFTNSESSDNPSGLYTCRHGSPWMVADAGNSPLLKKTYTVAPEATIPAPACPDGQTPFISVSPATLPQALSSGTSLYSYYTGSGTNADPWIVHLEVNGAPSNQGTLSVITSCSGSN
ncbi:MAG: shufflon system plasmid conjugative transfer pilus tip adhesin PilV [Desulfovibrio sp.]|nr:shufflon system plasmid conjugative transfer pilus tip adhesin PilV [Desulfovibrio sp.]